MMQRSSSTLVLNVVLILLLALTLVHSSLASGSSSGDNNVKTCTNEGTCTDSTNKVNMSIDLVSSNDDDDGDDIATQLIHWLRANGAYINEKLTVRYVNPADVTSPRGVFALEDMDAGELLCHIPHTLLLKPREDTYLDNLNKRIRLNIHNDTDDGDVEELDESEIFDCGAIDAVYDAMMILKNKNEATKNDDAENAYVKYLLMQPKYYLPSFWSKVRDYIYQCVKNLIFFIQQNDIHHYCSDQMKRLRILLYTILSQHAKKLLNEMLATTRTNHLTNLDQLPREFHSR